MTTFVSQSVAPWWLHFIRFAAHPATVVLSLRSVAHLLLTRPAFAARFRALSGWHMLEVALHRYHDTPDVYFILLALMLGRPISSLPETPHMDAAFMASVFHDVRGVAVPEALDVILALVGTSFSHSLSASHTYVVSFSLSFFLKLLFHGAVM